MITYHVNHPNGSVTLSPGSTLNEAKQLCRSIGRSAKIVYSVDTAAELERQTKRGPFWARRLVMAGDYYHQTPAMSRARKRWARVAGIA